MREPDYFITKTGVPSIAVVVNVNHKKKQENQTTRRAASKAIVSKSTKDMQNDKLKSANNR